MLIINNNFEIIPHLIYPLIESGNRNNNNKNSNTNSPSNTKTDSNGFVINTNIKGRIGNAGINNIIRGIGNDIINNAISNEGVGVYSVSATNSFGNIERSFNKASIEDNPIYDYYDGDVVNDGVIDSQFTLNPLINNENIRNVKHIKWIDEENNFEKRPPTPLRHRDFVYNNVDKLLDYEDD